MGRQRAETTMIDINKIGLAHCKNRDSITQD